MKNNFYKLVLVTQKLEKNLEKYLTFLEMCLWHGVTAIQLREKNLDYADLFSFALHLKKLLHSFRTPLIINDSLKLAIDVDADGLHLGQDDGDIIEARKSLGSNKILGLTVNSEEQLLKANSLPLDYIGVGAIFPTQNKQNIRKIWGCSGLEEAVTRSRHKVIAIGGINLNNISDVLKTRVHGIAAIGVFHNTSYSDVATQKLFNLINDKNNAQRNQAHS